MRFLDEWWLLRSSVPVLAIAYALHGSVWAMTAFGNAFSNAARCRNIPNDPMIQASDNGNIQIVHKDCNRHDSIL